MYQSYAVFGQQFGELGEKPAVIPDANMLEHADRDDAIEPPTDVSIILYLESDTAIEATLLRPLGGQGLLVRRQRNTEYLDVRVLRKEESHPSPPRADIEDLLARLQRELGGDMSELILLRHFQQSSGLRKYAQE